jgi:signal transduction histidine kinase
MTEDPDVEAHRHRYRSPLAAIIGLSESALLRHDLDADLVKQLRAIRALAQEALEASAGTEAEGGSDLGGSRD